MKPIVYVDILFLLNFLLNTVTIYISFMLTKQRIKPWRLTLSAAFLSIYACVMFFPNIYFMYTAFGKAVALSIGCYIAHPTRSVTSALKNTAILFFSTIILGGIVFALTFTTSFGTATGSIISNGEFYMNVDSSTLIISIILAYSCVYVITEIKKTLQIQSGQLLDIKICFQENQIDIKGFLDTGCTLCEPITNTPVIIIDRPSAKKLLSKSLYLFCIGNQKSVSGEFAEYYRLIPYSTIDKKVSILSGIIPDLVQLDGITIKKCIVAISKQSLSNNDSFSAIFGVDIFEQTKFTERTP